MDFTRQPIIETIITPKEGHKLVIRNSKAVGQEEFFVDAVELVAFGHALFFRSLEKPKGFLVPTSDYEVIEVRETRMVLKHVGLEKSIKIGGGREKVVREEVEKSVTPLPKAVATPAPIIAPVDVPVAEETSDVRFERKKERRRNYRRRRGREEDVNREIEWEASQTAHIAEEGQSDKIVLVPPQEAREAEVREAIAISTSILTSLLPPPPNLISETIAKYRENSLFKDAFFHKEQVQRSEEIMIVEESKEETEKTETDQA